MKEQLESLLKGIQEIPENEFSKKILIPLFKQLGYHKVEFYGGTSERGKDILCWGVDLIGDLQVSVVQVKHFKFSNKASSKNSLQTVINQLTTCFQYRLPYSDGSRYLPDQAFLVTTYPIETKLLESRFGDYPNLVDKKIKILDGPRISELILKKSPELVSQILGSDYDIKVKIEPSLNNEILLRALGYHDRKELKEIYTDIDFSLGRHTTELFFNAKFEPSKRNFQIKEGEWEQFKINCFEIEQEFGTDFITRTFEVAEKEYIPTKERHIKWDNDREKLEKNLIILKNELRELFSELEKRKDRYEQARKKEKRKEIEGKKVNSEITEELLAKLETQELKVVSKEAEMSGLKADLSRHLEKEIVPYYNMSIDGEILENKISEKRKWIEDKVAFINETRPSTSQIKEFLTKSKTIIDSASIVLSYSIFSSVLFNGTKSKIRRNFDTTRFKLPIDQVFDTGLNLAVLGEAGAGKTTSLQMFCLNRKEVDDKLFIWVSLSRLIQNWAKIEKDLINESTRGPFEKGITIYLNSLGIKISENDFISVLKTQKVVLLLDGIDEAIKQAPWLNRVIKSLAYKYNENVQVIVSSRMSGDYLHEISFFTITLLPFTDDQRNTFIERWFNENKAKSEEIKNHLNNSKAIREVVRTPLLATTLCVLAENDLPLPSTEVRLYDDRLRLFTGYYDNVKNLSSRISSLPQTLEMIAQKLAYHLHSIGQREEDLETLKEHAIKLTINKLSTSNAKKAIEELVDPCNILVPMTDDGKFGFEHLRYQEHLAAKEIMTNRGINIVPLIRDNWWFGALTIFAQMNDSFEWFIHDISKKYSIVNSKEILLKMIKMRPSTERKHLERLIKVYVKSEGFDQFDDDIYY